MQTENRFFDDFAKMLNGVAGTVAGMGREAETSMKERMRSARGWRSSKPRDPAGARNRRRFEQSVPFQSTAL
jgi:hypothetical protein